MSYLLQCHTKLTFEEAEQEIRAMVEFAMRRYHLGHTTREDLKQELIVEASKALDRYRPDGGTTVATWLAMAIRLQLCHRVSKLPKQTPTEEVEDVPDQHDELAVFQDRDEVAQLLLALSPVDRLLICSRFGLPGGIASPHTKLGISRQAVDKRVNKALNKLRNICRLQQLVPSFH